MKLNDVAVEHMSQATIDKYWLILSDVFNVVDPVILRTGIERLSKDTLFFTIESEGVYSSVLFVTPVDIAGVSIGGIGGVCTREEYRGQGHGRLVMERAIKDTSETYGALLLWTRIPAYFRKFEFTEMPELFVPDPHGSTPMFFFHKEQSKLATSALENLPRDYF